MVAKQAEIAMSVLNRRRFACNECARTPSALLTDLTTTGTCLAGQGVTTRRFEEAARASANDGEEEAPAVTRYPLPAPQPPSSDMQLTRFKKMLALAFFASVAMAVLSVAEETTTEAAPETIATTEAPEHVEGEHHDGTISRVKRQYGCPSNCFSTCSNNYQCKRYNLRSSCVKGCCCTSTNISTACDGDAAVAGCLNGLCGQGYFCSAKNYCCRCQSGSSVGPCVNGYCPAGYACNTNDYCCPIGSSAALDVCVNGHCPTGYTCGAGNLCYQTASSG
uniref:CC domain-containing protein n=1 Tax=Panagrellus redivivus TaxID=6233 RepID=A0A7E4ZVZ5_PANRE